MQRPDKVDLSDLRGISAGSRRGHASGPISSGPVLTTSENKSKTDEDGPQRCFGAMDECMANGCRVHLPLF